MSQLVASIRDCHAEVMASGIRLLQPYLFAETEKGHVRKLLEFAGLPEGSHVLDVGCGIGECARIMREIRPDLRFTLVNISDVQLSDCPSDLDKVLCDAHRLPFPAESFDAVMFNAAIGNMDLMVALCEASRVLRHGGTLILNEVERVHGDNGVMESSLLYRAIPDAPLIEFAAESGLSLVKKETPAVVSSPLEKLWDGDCSFDSLMSGTRPAVWVFEKVSSPVHLSIASIFGRHQNVAFQLSGGKDSVALLHMLRPWWDRVTVFWLNPGNPFPETVDYIRMITSDVQNFVEINGRQPEIIAMDGWPSDVVPHEYTTDGHIVFGEKPFKVQSRLSCCYRSLMAPMHDEMIRRGMTCIIRGKRSEEADKSPTRSGDVVGGVELVYPLWDMASDDIFAYLKAEGIRLPPYYKHASHSLDCMDCTAWWGEGLSRYLEAEHPAQFSEYKRRVFLIKQAISEQMAQCEV